MDCTDKTKIKKKNYQDWLVLMLASFLPAETGMLFSPTKAISPCFNVKVMHIVVQQPFQALCMVYKQQSSLYLTENPESSTS